jgi:hypothetical protein
MDIDHLQGSEFFQHRPWGQSWRQRACTLFKRDLQTVRHESNKDMSLDAFITLMIDRPDGERLK